MQVKNALVRTILIVLALCVGAWLALGYRGIHLDEKGEDAVASFRHGPIPPEQAREALDALDDARFLNADQAPNLIEGNLRLWMGERDRAAAIAREITDREPENASAWFLAYLAESGAAKRAAIRRINELDPWAAEALR
jgi:hypothetical protein